MPNIREEPKFKLDVYSKNREEKKLNPKTFAVNKNRQTTICTEK